MRRRSGYRRVHLPDFVSLRLEDARHADHLRVSPGGAVGAGINEAAAAGLPVLASDRGAAEDPSPRHREIVGTDGVAWGRAAPLIAERATAAIAA